MITSTRLISVPGGARGKLADHHRSARDVLQHPGRLAEEMVVVVDIGVEIGAAGFDHDFAQQAGGRELVQGVVDRRQRHADRRGDAASP